MDNILIENWKPIKGYEYSYEVSDLGNVRSLERYITNTNNIARKQKGQIIKACLDTEGYLILGLSKKNKKQTCKVHQLVAIAFLNHKRCGHEIVVDHINNIRIDNKISNLQLISSRQNATKDRKTKYTGVHKPKDREKYRAEIYANGKKVNLGNFKKEIDASNEYQRALREYKKTGKISRPFIKKTSQKLK
jgi:hypothetical protein